jgi:O-antigen/teichoic acid export membrane protein
MSRAIIIKNTISQLAGRLSVTVAGFVVAVIIARSYGVSGFGEFTTITALISFGYLFVDFGLNAAYLKQDAKRVYFTDFLFLRFLLGILAAFSLILPIIVASFFGITFFSITPPLYPGLIIFSLTILTQAVLVTYSALFQMHKRYELQAYALVPGALILVLLSLWVARSDLPLTGMYVAYVLSSLVSVGISAFLMRKNFSAKKPDREFVTSLVKKGLPLGLLLIFNLLYFRIDTLLLSAIKGPDAVGIYGYAYKYFDFALTVPLFLSNSLYPFLIKTSKNARKGKVNEKEYFFVFLFLGLFGAIGGVIGAPIISLISPGFDDSVVVLRILSLSLPFFFLTSYLQWLFIARDRERGLLAIYVGVALVNVALNLIFLEKHSYIAAAIITGVCEGIVLSLLLYNLLYTKNLRKVSSNSPVR